MPQVRTHEWEGHEIVLNGSRICPHPELCDIREGESLEKYARRHARDHHLDPRDSAPFEDIERNLSLYCLYFIHKHEIGNWSLTPYPFWSTHEFVSNWRYHEDDLEMRLWSDDDPLAPDDCTFELKPYSERLRAWCSEHQRENCDGDYRRFMELEIPRGAQKTSTVGKALVTQEHLRAYFIDKNPNFRVINISATTTLTEGVTLGLELIWERNRNIKRLFGKDHCNSKGVVVGRDSIYGKKGKNYLQLRWLSDADDSSGMAPFSVLYGGVGTEACGQRADLYIFDDGSTKKNSRTDIQREKVKEGFVEQVKQLDPNGRFIVNNTRKHLDDFGGLIKTPAYRKRFWIMHRRAEWVDPVSKETKYFYPADGRGTPKYDAVNLAEIHDLSEERDFWSEMMNWPMDPKKALFKREHFQIIHPDTAPIEIKYGLGRELTSEERAELDRAKLRIVGYNLFDPAGKERQSLHGDDNASVSVRVDRYGRLFFTRLRSGKWASNEVWQEIETADAYNHPVLTDYEMPASELHIENAWKFYLANRNAERSQVGLPPLYIPVNFEGLPKSSKPSRIESLHQWAKNGWIFILANAAPEAAEIQKFVRQFLEYLITGHDDYADAASRIVRFLRRPTSHALEEAKKAPAGPQMKDGVLRVTAEQLLKSFDEKKPVARVNWGLRGGVKHRGNSSEPRPETAPRKPKRIDW
jgi:hypothetical protein